MWHKDGFAAEDAGLEQALARLEQHLAFLPELFRAYNREERLTPLAAGKWSRQQILGHLTDSAINNLRRFTEIQFSQEQPYQIRPYSQDELVKVNCYQQQPIEDLLTIWLALNQQIIWVSRNIPAEKLLWKVNPGYDNQQLRTLEWLIADYVAHIEHHLKQIIE